MTQKRIKKAVKRKVKIAKEKATYIPKPPAAPLNGYQIPQYAIRIKPGTLEAAFKKLRKFGFVFTENRFTTFQQIRAQWPNCHEWTGILVGQSSNPCKMELHAGIAYDNIGRYTVVNMKTFIKDVVPTW